VEKSPGSFLFKIKSQFYKTFVRHFHKIPFLVTGFNAKIARTCQNQKYHIHFVTFFPGFCIFRCCHLAFMYCQKWVSNDQSVFVMERSEISFYLFPRERSNVSSSSSFSGRQRRKKKPQQHGSCQSYPHLKRTGTCWGCLVQSRPYCWWRLLQSS